MNRDNKLKLPIYDMRNQINWMKIILILFKITNFFKLTKIECSELCSQVNYMDKSFKKLNNILEQFNNIFISNLANRSILKLKLSGTVPKLG